jgi:Ca2+/Na+ antiporter
MHSSIRNLQSTDDSFELSDLFIDVYSLPDDGYGFFQLIFLTLVYGFILFTAANLISDGSEFLLLIPSIAGMVGSIVLPVLGAVPDAAIVVFSGLGSDAQYQLEVGMGALAGSTILLLTIPWALVIIAGRVDISEEGKANYKHPKLNLQTGSIF